MMKERERKNERGRNREAANARILMRKKKSIVKVTRSSKKRERRERSTFRVAEEMQRMSECGR